MLQTTWIQQKFWDASSRSQRLLVSGMQCRITKIQYGCRILLILQLVRCYNICFSILSTIFSEQSIRVLFSLFPSRFRLAFFSHYDTGLGELNRDVLAHSIFPVSQRSYVDAHAGTNIDSFYSGVARVLLSSISMKKSQKAKQAREHSFLWDRVLLCNLRVLFGLDWQFFVR